MIHFNLNIDLFFESEFKRGSILKSIACIEYPVFHIIAKTLETTEEEYDELDRFIVRTVMENAGFNLFGFPKITGLSVNVFEFRCNELRKQELIVLDGQKLTPTEDGVSFVNDNHFERNIIRTRSFLIDGYSHKPLKNSFYKEGKDNLISEYEKDTWGNKLFNPAIIHTPPKRDITDLITGVNPDERPQYNIPVGLKTILDFDFVLMTYPLGITLSIGSSGVIKKRIIDLNGFYPNEDYLIDLQELLKDEINKLEIFVEEKEVTFDGAKTKKYHFRNSWSKNLQDSNRIFNLTKEQVKHFVNKLYGIESICDDNLDVTGTEIVLKVDAVLFETVDKNKKKLIDACLRKRDYYRQYEGTGVWLVFLMVEITDDYVQSLVDLYVHLQIEESIQGLVDFYSGNYRLLRKNIYAIEQFEKLEELDTYLFMRSRESEYRQNFLSIVDEEAN